MKELKSLLSEMGIKLSLPALQGKVEGESSCTCGVCGPNPCGGLGPGNPCQILACLGGICSTNACVNASGQGPCINGLICGGSDNCAGSACVNYSCYQAGACSGQYNGSCTGDVCSGGTPCYATN